VDRLPHPVSSIPREHEHSYPLTAERNEPGILDIKHILENAIFIVNKQFSCFITSTVHLFSKIKLIDMMLEKSFGEILLHNLT
jgi:hypothetical protein